MSEKIIRRAHATAARIRPFTFPAADAALPAGSAGSEAPRAAAAQALPSGVLTSPPPEADAPPTPPAAPTPESLAAEREQVLAAARTEAEQFLVQAQQEAARLKEQAYEEGYAAGLAAGKEAMAAELASLVAALRQAVAEVIALRPDRLRQAEEDILTLASAMAHAILQREACQSRDVLATMLTQALERLGASGQVVVWVHPLDLALARDLQAAWHDPEVQLVIRSDERVGRGGCRVTSTLGEVDARLEAQLHEIERHLRQHLFTESEEASP